MEKVSKLKNFLTLPGKLEREPTQQRAATILPSALTRPPQLALLAGRPLTEEEVRGILATSNGLALLKGKWVEVDGEKLEQVLEHWRKVQSEAGVGGVSLLQGLRMISGFQSGQTGDEASVSARA